MEKLTYIVAKYKNRFFFLVVFSPFFKLSTYTTAMNGFIFVKIFILSKENDNKRTEETKNR